jgi:hypothetical protein
MEPETMTVTYEQMIGTAISDLDGMNLNSLSVDAAHEVANLARIGLQIVQLHGRGNINFDCPVCQIKHTYASTRPTEPVEVVNYPAKEVPTLDGLAAMRARPMMYGFTTEAELLDSICSQPDHQFYQQATALRKENADVV